MHKLTGHPHPLPTLTPHPSVTPVLPEPAPFHNHGLPLLCKQRENFLFCRRCNAFVATPPPCPCPSPKNLFAELFGGGGGCRWVGKSFSLLILFFFLRPANRTNNSTQLAECFAISALLNLLKICEANAQKKRRRMRKRRRERKQEERTVIIAVRMLKYPNQEVDKEIKVEVIGYISIEKNIICYDKDT